jgi:hypothetical protein
MSKMSLLIKIFIGVMAYFMFISDGIDLARIELSRKNWISVQGKNEDIILTDRPFNGNKNYVTTRLKYSYEAEGKKYEATEILELNAIYPESRDFSSIKEAAIARHPPGAAIRVRVDPDDKNESTTFAANDGYAYMIAWGVVIELILISWIVISYKKKKELDQKLKRAL